MNDSKTKLTALVTNGPATKPTEPMAVFVRTVYGPFGCYKTGQKLTRKQLGRRWDEWLQARIIRVL